MNIIIISQLQDKFTIPIDILRYINEFVKYDKITNHNIRDAVNMWFINRDKCKIKYGHITHWNVINVTSMYRLFYNLQNFNEDISLWNVSNVINMSGMFYNAISFNGDISY